MPIVIQKPTKDVSQMKKEENPRQLKNTYKRDWKYLLCLGEVLQPE